MEQRPVEMQNPTDISKRVLVVRIQWFDPPVLKLLNHVGFSPLDYKNNIENLKGLSKQQLPKITSVIILDYVL